jgi:signal-transduction protein with cAMP-binding, CBS, and nucleotidyltransferase domain
MLDADEEVLIMTREIGGDSLLDAEILDAPLSELCSGPAETMDISGTVGEAVQIMRARRIGSVLITSDGCLAGIVTERDFLFRETGPLQGVAERPVSDFMTPNPETLRLEDPVLYVMNKMHMGGFRHVPIVNEEGVPLHVISVKDVMAYMLGHFESKVANLPVEPFRGVSLL